MSKIILILIKIIPFPIFNRIDRVSSFFFFFFPLEKTRLFFEYFRWEFVEWKICYCWFIIKTINPKFFVRKSFDSNGFSLFILFSSGILSISSTIERISSSLRFILWKINENSIFARRKFVENLFFVFSWIFQRIVSSMSFISIDILSINQWSLCLSRFSSIDSNSFSIFDQSQFWFLFGKIFSSKSFFHCFHSFFHFKWIKTKINAEWRMTNAFHIHFFLSFFSFSFEIFSLLICSSWKWSLKKGKRKRKSIERWSINQELRFFPFYSIHRKKDLSLSLFKSIFFKFISSEWNHFFFHT